MARGPHRCCSAPRLSCFMCLHSTDQLCGQFSGSCVGTSAWSSQGCLCPACVFTLSCPCRTWPMPFSRKPRPQGRHTSCRAQLSQQGHTAQKLDMRGTKLLCESQADGMDPVFSAGERDQGQAELPPEWSRGSPAPPADLRRVSLAHLLFHHSGAPLFGVLPFSLRIQS